MQHSLVHSGSCSTSCIWEFIGNSHYRDHRIGRLLLGVSVLENANERLRVIDHWFQATCESQRSSLIARRQKKSWISSLEPDYKNISRALIMQVEIFKISKSVKACPSSYSRGVKSCNLIWGCVDNALKILNHRLFWTLLLLLLQSCFSRFRLCATP